MPAPPRTPQGFADILELIWWRLDRALDLDLIGWSAMLGALECLEVGATAVIDHHESPNAIEGSLSVIADACAAVGVRVSCAYGVTDRHGPDGARRGLAENERFLRSGGQGYVGVHAAFTCTDATLEAAAGLAADLGTGVHIHVAEGQVDTPAAQRLANLSGPDWLLIHGVHLPDDHGLAGTFVHNPRSNMNNAVGYARPARFAATGNPVALGTDGIGSDMLDEFRVAYARLRGERRDRQPRDALAVAVGRLGPHARGPGRHRHLELRPHGAVAPGLQPRRAPRAGRGGRRGCLGRRPTHPSRRRRGARQSSRGRPVPLPPPRRPGLTRTTDMIRPTTRRNP